MPVAHALGCGSAFRVLLTGALWLALGVLPAQAQTQTQTQEQKQEQKQEQALCAYTARISARDKVDTAGRNILGTVNKPAVLAAIRMDRANYHRYNKRDAEDEADCRFAPLAERQKLDAMAAKTTLEPGLMEKLKREEPVLRIQVFADRLEVS
ncbi:MAG: hypothetical protein ACKOWC_01155, partial [Limnohabitans sp.]